MIYRKQFSSLVMVLLTPSIVFAKAAQCPANSSRISFHSLKDSEIAISVSINHSHPYDFIVDTGAQVTVIDPRLAAELNLRALGSGGLATMLGREAIDLAKAELVEAGPVAVHDLIVAALNLSQTQAVDPGVRGILGENFLGRFDLLLDYAHKMICLDPSKDLQKQLQGERVPMIEQGARNGDQAYTAPVLVAAHFQADDRDSMVLRLDSGTNIPVLFESPRGIVSWAEHEDTRWVSSAGNGRARCFAIMPVQGVKIGSHTTRQIAFLTPINPEHTSAFAGEDGLLPTVLFERIFISYADHFVMFDPLPNMHRSTD